ncbi:uncharacterized protein FPRO_07221 [Fusarium proliferatum ET1]|uniref:Uncharacterized protein n=1 Tax=Fusarium proliferatum (strain ET1) TaxID=1227346 RepID=A0A1L7V9Y5_FUSPR|nr:uncharacterized protein FPRO_07221 [Fusarium proliferatum ET1]CZR37588.1 uncharacterized protein FPRO_07221 [Fusarium proliferatum ET1]
MGPHYGHFWISGSCLSATYMVLWTRGDIVGLFPINTSELHRGLRVILTAIDVTQYWIQATSRRLCQVLDGRQQGTKAGSDFLRNSKTKLYPIALLYCYTLVVIHLLVAAYIWRTRFEEHEAGWEDRLRRGLLKEDQSSSLQSAYKHTNVILSQSLHTGGRRHR